MPETNNIENNQAMQFDAIQIGLASPEKIREWSHGEVVRFGWHTVYSSEKYEVSHGIFFG